MFKQKENVPFVKMRDFSDNDPRLVYSEKFRRGVNFSYSGVHIPVEIYEECKLFKYFIQIFSSFYCLKETFAFEIAVICVCVFI